MSIEVRHGFSKKVKGLIVPKFLDFRFDLLFSKDNFKTSRRHDRPFAMPVKVLIMEKNELRLRIIGESHTALQMLRERLNGHKNVDYANYFPGHPELDDPEFYIRIKGKSSVEKLLKEIVDGISKDFASISL